MLVYFRCFLVLVLALFICQCDTYDEYDKAAVVWLASTIGNDCMVMDTTNQEVSCELLDSLGISPLFGEKHMEFLNTWFEEDSITLSYFNEDPYLPLGGSSASNKVLSYQIFHFSDLLILRYKGAYWVHGSSGEFREEVIFRMHDNSLEVISPRHHID